MCLWLGVGGLGAHVWRENQTVQVLACYAAAASAAGSGAMPGGNAQGNAPEDHGSGLLNGFQALAQETGVSVPKLDVVLGCGSVLKSDRLANHKGHGLGLGFADLLGGQRATVATMQHFVSNLMHECRKFLGGLHPG
jgi:hypothetical protein